MKRTQLLIAAVILISGFAACKNSSEEAKQGVTNLSLYVDSVDNAVPVYTMANWSEIDNAYQQRLMEADKYMDKMSADEKATADSVKLRYLALKTKYENKIKEMEAEAAQAKAAAEKPDYKTVLRNGLFGEGKIGADMKFSWVTADNIHNVYEKFVNTVDDNKNKYTREDWDEIKLLYEALDSRKNEVEKDLATKDNLKIAALKVKFAAIKSVERPLAKAKENEKAKN